MDLNNLHWLGHASFRFDGSKIIYFDPWKLTQGSPMADIIFISHDHFDHFSKPDIMLISSKNTTIVSDRAAAKQLQGARIDCKEIKGLSAADKIEISGVKIQAVSSYNINKGFHLKSSNKLGFVVALDDLTIYHAGDTDIIPEMAEVKCDIALLPVGGTYTMTAEEAAQAALVIQPKVAIPMHYGSGTAGTPNDGVRFRDALKGKIEVMVLRRE